MARLHTYICHECGYELRSNPAGFDAVRSGLFIFFRCDKCKEIVSITPEQMGKYWIDCPNCDGRVTATWNPVEGNCPKCGNKMEDTGNIIMAD